MKILIIGPFSPPITGVSFANDTLFDGLKKRNINVDYINFSYPTLKEDIGVFSLKKTLYYLRLYLYIYKVFFNKTIYMTPGQTFFGVIKYVPFILMVKILRKETIIHVHGNHLWKEYENLKGIQKKLFNLILSSFNKGIVLSKSLRKNLDPFINNENIYEVYNFVEDNILDKVTLNDINSKKLKKLNIIFLSNLMKEKGIYDFLESLLILKKNGVKFKAKVAGAIDSTSENKLNTLFKNLQEEVDYLGIVRGNNKLKLLLNSNVFVFPTYYAMEGQPITILEAMATGNIIMTTKHAGIPDIFNEKKNGVYIEKNDPNDIAIKLQALSNSLDGYNNVVHNNYLEASTKYSTKIFIDKIIKIIKK